MPHRSTFHPRARLSAALFALLLVNSASAVLTPAYAQSALEIERREREARLARERELERAQPQVQLQDDAAEAVSHRDVTLPQEVQCRRLQRIVLDGAPRTGFGFARRYLARYEGRCVGAEGVGLIVRRLGDLILDRGYVTTRVGVAQQNLADGVLRVQVVPGRLRHLRVDGVTPEIVANALPLRPGDVINLRAIEQGLEQLKRVPSQDARIDVEAAEAPGLSDLRVSVSRGRRLRGTLALDDSGSQSTGRIQGNTSLAFDNLVGLNDIISVGLGHDLVGERAARGTRSHSLGYSLGWGHWQLDAGRSRFNYRQTVEGQDVAFTTSGRTDGRSLGLQRNLHRGQSHRSSVEVRASTQAARSFVEDEELLNQRRRTTAVELALRHRQQWGRVRLDGRLSQRRGVPWLGGQRDRGGTPGDYPTWQYRVTSLDLSVDLPLTRRLAWTSELRLQHTGDVLYANEQIALGSRYSVRGFDGEQALAAERGGYLRNTLALALGADIGLYLGVDAGRVSGPSAPAMSRRSLSGAVIGARGAVGRASWDVFTGRGLHAPRGVRRDPVVGLQAALAL